ncbi:hypothetical protein G6F59_018505 [Rhizopus arrhizus]|nr:hypothetical protein G6F59_018505 [Rhizopus arrhizus]
MPPTTAKCLPEAVSVLLLSWAKAAGANAAEVSRARLRIRMERMGVSPNVSCFGPPVAGRAHRSRPNMNRIRRALKIGLACSASSAKSLYSWGFWPSVTFIQLEKM